MLYGFRHYQTTNGRRIECAIARDEYERAMARIAPDYFAGAQRVDGSDDVQLTTTVAAAVRLAEALAGVGGDAAVTARLLTDQLDAVIEEMQRARRIGSPVTHARRGLEAVGMV